MRLIADGVRRDLWDDVVSGKLSLPIDKSFALTEADDAYSYMTANKHFGKIVLRM